MELNSTYLQKCPFNQKNLPSGCIMHIGSQACCNCHFFTDKNGYIVECSYKEKTELYTKIIDTLKQKMTVINVRSINELYILKDALFFDEMKIQNLARFVHNIQNHFADYLEKTCIIIDKDDNEFYLRYASVEHFTEKGYNIVTLDDLNKKLQTTDLSKKNKIRIVSF